MTRQLLQEGPRHLHSPACLHVYTHFNCSPFPARKTRPVTPERQLYSPAEPFIHWKLASINSSLHKSTTSRAESGRDSFAPPNILHHISAAGKLKMITFSPDLVLPHRYASWLHSPMSGGHSQVQNTVLILKIKLCVSIHIIMCMFTWKQQH